MTEPDECAAGINDERAGRDHAGQPPGFQEREKADDPVGPHAEGIERRKDQRCDGRQDPILRASKGAAGVRPAAPAVMSGSPGRHKVPSRSGEGSSDDGQGNRGEKRESRLQGPDAEPAIRLRLRKELAEDGSRVRGQARRKAMSSSSAKQPTAKLAMTGPEEGAGAGVVVGGAAFERSRPEIGGLWPVAGRSGRPTGVWRSARMTLQGDEWPASSATATPAKSATAPPPAEAEGSARAVCRAPGVVSTFAARGSAPVERPRPHRQRHRFCRSSWIGRFVMVMGLPPRARAGHPVLPVGLHELLAEPRDILLKSDDLCEIVRT